MTRRTALVVVGLTAALAGCAVGNQLVAPHDEYRLYRATHVAPTLEERLAAANRYLHVAPDGAYAPELKAWFSAAERDYVTRARNRLPMLEAYARALPDGPRAPEVRARIEELRATAAFLEELSSFVVLFSTVRSFGQPLAALPAEVLVKLDVQSTSAGCPSDVCAKSLAPRFAIPSPEGPLVPREAAYTAEIAVNHGVVVALRLRGRELWSRVGEALERRPVSFADPQSRAEAIGRALGLVGNSLGTELGAPDCERPAVSPVVLDHACGGVRATMTAGLESGDEDRLEWAAALPPAPRAVKP